MFSVLLRTTLDGPILNRKVLLMCSYSKHLCHYKAVQLRSLFDNTHQTNQHAVIMPKPPPRTIREAVFSLRAIFTRHMCGNLRNKKKSWCFVFMAYVMAFCIAGMISVHRMLKIFHFFHTDSCVDLPAAPSRANFNIPLHTKNTSFPWPSHERAISCGGLTRVRIFSTRV